MENALKRKLVFAAAVLIVFALLAYPLLKKKENGSLVYSRLMMGTVVELTLFEGDEASFDNAAEAAFDEMKRLEGLLSSYDPDSDVSRISKSGGQGPVKVAPEVVEVAEAALQVAELSGGAFDPTVGALAKAWGYSGESGTVPSQGEIKKLLPLVAYKKVKVDRNNNTVELENEGMVLNLGGVAKGYIVKKAVDALKKEGVTKGIVHAGGDMTVFQKDGEPFKIGIRHPRKEGLLGEAYVEEGAAPTSGDYERFFEKDGARYHHILDPKTGFPARGTMSVTIIAKDPTFADALSTAVFVMGPEKGMELVEKLEGVEAVIVDEAGKVRTSRGFKGRVY